MARQIYLHTIYAAKSTFGSFSPVFISLKLHGEGGFYGERRHVFLER